MANSDFGDYVGDPDIHDGRIVSIQQTGDQVRVTIEATTGRQFSLEFRGVESLNSNHAEGMVLYALTESRTGTSMRRFVFSNWNEEDDAYLEISAKEFAVSR